MQIETTIASTRRALTALRSTTSPFGATLGLVPTMGALHAGHLSLIARAKADNVVTAATIFVNPLQFGPTEDLARYPRTFAEDCAQLERAGVDLLFAPTPDEMYPRGNAAPATLVDPGPIANRLDGASRPGHFLGVATVVAKLFNITQPTRAYFGQKDAAQLAVLRHITLDLDLPVKLIGCPIVRDPDGLALSSRNRYLTSEQRAHALTLPRILAALSSRIVQGTRDSAALHAEALCLLDLHPELTLDYLALVDPDTLLPVPVALPGTLVAIAAKVGATRLIDNFLAP
jgi:pantoate--beta-alanine ligase